LILGCTHYPLLAGPIGKLMGPQVALINSGRAAALEVQRRLRATDLAARTGRRGELHCYTTDDPRRFVRLGERFGGRPIDHVQLVGTDELERRTSPTSP
jgi:glutamate racemase